MKFPVFDLHCDTSNELIGQGYFPKSDLRRNPCQIDLERAGKMGGYAQCFACFTTSEMQGDPTELFLQKKDALLQQFALNNDIIRQAFCAADVEKNQDEGFMSAILTIEGPCGFGCDPAALESLHKEGFLITSLGWNEGNVLTGSNVTGGGLTHMGREYVKEAQRLGMAVDVSHISDEGFWDIINITDAPIFATHSNSRVLCPHRRNLTDDMFRAIVATDGVVGINMYNDFLGPGATLDTVCDHILHFAQIDPDFRHIALGGDLDGVDALPQGFGGVQDYPALADRLLSRGLTPDIINRIFWSNPLRALTQCEK